MSRKNVVGEFKKLFNESLIFYAKKWFLYFKVVLVFFGPAFLLEYSYLRNDNLKEYFINSTSINIYNITNGLIAFLFFILFILYFAAILIVVSLAEKDSSLGGIKAYQKSIKNFFPFIKLQAAYLLKVLGGLVLVIVPGIIKGGLYSFSGFIFFRDTQDIKRTFSESEILIRPYMKEYFLNIFLMLIATIAIIFAAATIFDVVVNFVGSYGYIYYAVALDNIGGVFLAMISVFPVVFNYCYYKRLSKTTI